MVDEVDRCYLMNGDYLYLRYSMGLLPDLIHETLMPMVER